MRTNLISRIAFYLLVAAILIYTVFPFYWAFRSSIADQSELFSTPISYWPKNPTLSNYVRIFTENSNFTDALRNSVIVAGSVTILSLVIGALGAYALGRFRFRGRTPVMYVVLSMTMFPQIAVLGSLFSMVYNFGLYNKLGALVLTYLIFTLPFTVWVLTSFFQAMPRELEEASYVDGATPFQTFYRVMLPLVGPGLVTTGLLAFIGAWNEFLFAVSFTQTPEHRTVTVAIFNFSTTTGGGFEIPWGQMMAATIVVTIPLIVLALVFQRYILGGLTAGAVKG
jgi:trehalose/maltose transport system permease protein